ncbi:MAG TPA: ABC transporter permease [Terriglobia bacterium]|nr:ABC transporter permease [Terriglobia bacterium]
MRFLDIQKMAVHALGKNKIQTALTMLGIVIGVSAVIAMVSLGQGAQKLVQDQVAGMGQNVLQIQGGGGWNTGGGGARQGGDQASLTEGDVEAISREVPTVKLVTPIAQAQGQFVFGNQNWQSRVEGSNEHYLEIRGLKIDQGEFFTDSDVRTANRVVVLGKTVSDNLFQGSDPVGQTIRIRNLPYRVIGVLTPKGQSATGQDQDDFAIMPYTTVQKKMTNSAVPRINRITVSAIGSTATVAAKEQITELLKERHSIRPGQPEDFRVNNLTEVAEAAESTTRIMTLLLGSIAAVSLLVGGIGIMNIMLVSVTERTREIGIRMAIGSRGSYIRMQFLAESVILCMLGGLIGVLVGIGLSLAIAQVMGWPSFVSPQAASIAFLFSAATGIFFGYYPAHKAASLDPIEALRYE